MIMKGTRTPLVGRGSLKRCGRADRNGGRAALSQAAAGSVEAAGVWFGRSSKVRKSFIRNRV